MRRILLVGLGAYVCVLGAAVHRHETDVLGVRWSWGLAVALLTTLAIATGAGVVVRAGAAWFGLGWALALMAQQYSPGGSYLVASDATGWIFSVGGVGSVVIGVALAPKVGA